MKKHFIAYSIFLLLTLNIYSESTRTSQFNEVKIINGGIWEVSKKEVDIEGCFLIGNSLFAIKAVVDDINDKDFAKKIAAQSLINDSFLFTNAIAEDNNLSIIDDTVGIALIDKTSLPKIGIIDLSTAKGHRYQFKIKDLLASLNTQELPIFFKNKDYQKEFIDKYCSYFNRNKIDNLYEFYGDFAEKMVTYETYEKGHFERKKVFKEIIPQKLKYYFYVGKSNGLRGYYLYYKINITSDIYNQNGYLRLLAVEDNEKFNIIEMRIVANQKE